MRVYSQRHADGLVSVTLLEDDGDPIAARDGSDRIDHGGIGLTVKRPIEPDMDPLVFNHAVRPAPRVLEGDHGVFTTAKDFRRRRRSSRLDFVRPASALEQPFAVCQRFG
jgi:hypothetical protein